MFVGMVVLRHLLAGFCCVFAAVRGADALYIGTSVSYGENWNLWDNVEIDDEVTVNADDINVNLSVTIVNNGVINGNINVAPGRIVKIRNSGVINGSIDVADGGRLVQLIQNSADVTKINTTDGFDVFVDNASGISLVDLGNIANGANNIIIENSNLILDGNASIKSNTPIELVGDVSLYVEDTENLTDGPVLSNVRGDGMLHVFGGDAGSLYRLTARVADGNLYMDYVRDTDYARVLDNKNLGNFLNDLRKSNANDKLLAALDGAKDIDELNAIMSQSMRLAPMKLMTSVRMLNFTEMSRVRARGDSMSLMPVALFADGMDALGGAIERTYGVGDTITLGIAGYVFSLSQSDDFEEYKSALYGGNVHIAYFDDDIFARALAGISVANFNIGSVFNGTDTVSNPMGLSVYSVADFGFVFDVAQNVEVVPFVRGGVDYANIAKLTDTEFVAAAGANLLVDFAGYDLKYKYGFGIAADIRGMFNVDAEMHILSPNDGFAGTVSVGAVYDDIVGFGVKVGLSAAATF